MVTCKTGKVCMPSHKAAMIVRKKRGNPVHLQAYQCPQCKQWHLGRTRDPYLCAIRIDQVLAEYNKRKKPAPA